MLVWKWPHWLMRVLEAEKTFVFWRPPRTILSVNSDLQKADYLWWYSDRNSCMRNIYFMGMWPPGTSWSRVTWLPNFVIWAWRMKFIPTGPSPLLAPAPSLSSGSLQNGFSWDLQASGEMCMLFLLFCFLFVLVFSPENASAYNKLFLQKSQTYS